MRPTQFNITTKDFIDFKKTSEFKDRASYRPSGYFDFTVKIWKNREAMASAIRKQQKRARHFLDWNACVSLTDGEGY